MNEQLQQFARHKLKEGLDQLPVDWQRRFKLMYAFNGATASPEDIDAIPIHQFVDGIPSYKLALAMSQVTRSLAKFSAQLDEEMADSLKKFSAEQKNT